MTQTTRISRLLQVWLLGMFLLAPFAVSANHLDISRLATELNLATGQLAYELRGYGAYSNLRQRADRLSREAADLVDAVRRNRNESQVRSQFNDVSKRYANLEQAFLRINRTSFSPYLTNEFDRINGIFTNLSAEFFYQGGNINPRSFSYASPSYNQPVINRRYESAPDYYYQHNQRGLDNSGTSYQSAPATRRDRRDYGRIQVQRMPQYDHRSAVLERQQILDNRRPTPERSQRGISVETNRRNHYD